MRRRYTSRPAPAASILAAIIGVFMLIFAVVFFSKAKSAPGPVMAFFGLWVVAVIAVIIYHVANAARPDGVPTQVIEGEDEVAAPKSTTQRLQELEDLRSRKLVSDAEYETKRQEILKGL